MHLIARPSRGAHPSPSVILPCSPRVTHPPLPLSFLSCTPSTANPPPALLLLHSSCAHPPCTSYVRITVPVWEETFTLEARSQPACWHGIASTCFPACAVSQLSPHEEVVLTLFDSDNFSADDEMGEVRVPLGLLMRGSVAESWHPIMPTMNSVVGVDGFSVRGHICLRWQSDVSFAAGGAWKARSLIHLVLQATHLVVLGMTLLHLTQRGYYLYVAICATIIILTSAVSLMFATSSHSPIEPSVGVRTARSRLY